MAISLEDLRRAADAQIAGLAAGEPLAPLTRALVALGVAVSVTSLDRPAIAAGIDDAIAAGATIAQVQEVIALVSGLGVHSLMASAAPLLGRPAARALAEAPLSPDQQALWARYIGDDPYWIDFEAAFPGFLDALLRLSPAGFRGFHDYCAIPWAGGAVPARTKELVAMACDATPTHRFLPGLHLHLRNAIKLGIGRLAIEETLRIAAMAPGHDGVA